MLTIAVGPHCGRVVDSLGLNLTEHTECAARRAPASAVSSPRYQSSRQREQVGVGIGQTQDGALDDLCRDRAERDAVAAIAHDGKAPCFARGWRWRLIGVLPGPGLDRCHATQRRLHVPQQQQRDSMERAQSRSSGQGFETRSLRRRPSVRLRTQIGVGVGGAVGGGLGWLAGIAAVVRGVRCVRWRTDGPRRIAQ